MLLFSVAYILHNAAKYSNCYVYGWQLCACVKRFVVNNLTDFGNTNRAVSFTMCSLPETSIHFQNVDPGNPSASEIRWVKVMVYANSCAETDNVNWSVCSYDVSKRFIQLLQLSGLYYTEFALSSIAL